jgi:hypothetical protein
VSSIRAPHFGARINCDLEASRGETRGQDLRRRRRYWRGCWPGRRGRRSIIRGRLIPRARVPGSGQLLPNLHRSPRSLSRVEGRQSCGPRRSIQEREHGLGRNSEIDPFGVTQLAHCYPDNVTAHVGNGSTRVSGVHRRVGLHVRDTGTYVSQSRQDPARQSAAAAL